MEHGSRVARFDEMGPAWAGFGRATIVTSDEQKALRALGALADYDAAAAPVRRHVLRRTTA